MLKIVCSSSASLRGELQVAACSACNREGRGRGDHESEIKALGSYSTDTLMRDEGSILTKRLGILFAANLHENSHSTATY